MEFVSTRIRFQVDHRALLEAFDATRMSRTRNQVCFRVLDDHLVFSTHSNNIRCEADIKCLTLSGIVRGRTAVIQMEANLFSDFLCSQRLRNSLPKDVRPIDFVVIPTPAAKKTGVEPLRSGELHVEFGSLNIDWPVTYVSEHDGAAITHIGSPVDPQAISRALALVYDFAAKKADNHPQYELVRIYASQARAGAPKNARFVEAPEIDGIDLHVSRENAEDLKGVLRHFDRQATRMWIDEREQGFFDDRRRCVVAIAPEGANLKRLDGLSRICSAFISTVDFETSVVKILSQTTSRNDIVQVSLNGGGDGDGKGNGAIRLRTSVNGGVAVVTCSALRVCSDTDSAPLVTREFWLTTEGLAKAIAWPASVGEIELRLFEEEAVLFRQVVDDSIADTFLMPMKAP